MVTYRLGNSATEYRNIDELIRELIFVEREGREGGKIAIEANLGLVAFGESKAELIADIQDKVRQHFKAGFNGQIRLRKFTDTLIEGNQQAVR